VMRGMAYSFALTFMALDRAEQAPMCPRPLKSHW
jgi:hypothetical protein